MSERSVYFVVGDIGGVKEVLPVARAMTRKNWRVKFVADSEGKGKERLLQEVLPGVMASDFPAAGEAYGIVVGTSATAFGAQLAWTALGKANGIPVIWVEDMYGTASRPAVMDVDPDMLIVMDMFAHDIARAARPKSAILARGKPSMADAVAKIERRQEIRKRVRRELELHCIDSKDRALLVTYWSGGEDPERAHRHLLALRDVTGAGGRKMRIAVRLHPKIGEEDRKALVAAAKSGLNWLAPFESVNGADPEDLIVASDLNVFDWGGTGAVVSVLAGIPTVVTYFPDDSAKRKRIYPGDGDPPLVAARAVLVAKDKGELVRQIEVSLEDRETTEGWVRSRSMPFRPLLTKDADEAIGAEIAHILRNPPRPWS